MPQPKPYGAVAVHVPLLLWTKWIEVNVGVGFYIEFFESNMLYLETPIGVGFSYSTDPSSMVIGDKITGIDNLMFLKNWFLKFPQYKERDLFITGESYAGHYVPQLAELMMQFNKKHKLFNLKGIVLGNPVLEFATDFKSRAEYFWSHGLISDSTYRVFTTACNYSRYVSEYYRSSVSPVCSRVMSRVSRETSKFVDKYDVTLDVCMSSVLSQSKIISPQQVPESIDVCVKDETVKYLNRQDVKKALHARLIGVNKWAVCSNVLDYELLDLEIPTIPIVGSLVKAGIPVLFYSGDQDSVIPLTGSRKLVQRLSMELRLNDTTPYRGPDLVATNRSLKFRDREYLIRSLNSVSKVRDRIRSLNFISGRPVFFRSLNFIFGRPCFF
ncbi:Serine carboxypeptidase-like 45 [Ranunculus cassubicifolius]